MDVRLSSLRKLVFQGIEMRLPNNLGYTVVLALPLVLCFTGFSAMAVEKSKYKVLETNDGFEIREYPPQVVAETLVEGDFDDAGNQGFRRLFDYISGNNRSGPSVEMTAPVTQVGVSQKIAMTAPVGQMKTGSSWRITFVMPSKYAFTDLPEPGDNRVVLAQDPERTVAAIKYSGTWSTDLYLANKDRLEKYIAERGFDTVGEPVWARYDPPFMPWFMRRNEILIPISY